MGVLHMDDTRDLTSAPTAHVRQMGMSYKFQRLRERLRASIASGEFAGKLPGERALAARFDVNAKTLSKALTDLAAEGLLDRSIGRGTYVKGTLPAAPVQQRWLVLCDAREDHGPLAQALRGLNPTLHAATHSVGEMRPSFLNPFEAVIDIASDTPESFLRDMVVRGKTVVTVDRELGTYSMNAVLIDVAVGVARLGRDLILAGHRRLAAVEPRGSSTVVQALTQAAARYAADAIVDACTPTEITTLVAHGATGIVCGSTAAAEQVRGQLAQAGIAVPDQVSLTAVGCWDGLAAAAPCSGYFCTSRQLAVAVAELLKAPAGRPAALWLAGAFHERGTLRPTSTSASQLEELANVRVDGIVV
jgi:hypothetical protein